MAVKLQQITTLIDKIAPKRLAYKWDNVGLQVGDYNQTVSKVMLTLDITKEVLSEAKEEGVDLIIGHHPLIFKGISKIRYNTSIGRLIRDAIKEDISIYIAHTNYDIGEGGLNDYLAQSLGLTNTDVLQVTAREEMKKVVVFVPKDNLEGVREVMGRAGAGWIGKYSDCFFAQEGIGSFKALEGSEPYIGSKGELSEVEEVRLETIVPNSKLNKVVSKMIKAHPYEEVAYDVYPLDNPGSRFGLGRVGYLDEAITLREYCQVVKEELNLDTLRVIGSLDDKIAKVGVCSGSGGDYIKAASFKGVDVFVTGDIKYHEGQLAQEEGIALIDAGHYGTEKIVKSAMGEYLNKEIKSNNFKVEVIESKVNTDPFVII
ncbi:Nif3-like dinuclear metal center hexameric protein [Halonatronum saccharophilum]|uniref:Nif3-like dinuclear metal center hexameric protein n=1 Tax=Halonatronum saccharophilum TaxID=150060 RepID=UPI0004809641|nr:Nif3-like dinuclear metal center hexameric protein [Halonatronum saccharophilum]